MCLLKQFETNLLVIDANMAAATPSPEYLAETRGPMIRTVTWLSVIFPILFVALRVYTRLFVRKVFGLDDWVIVLSLILLICYGAIIEAAVQKGLGRHVEWVLTFAPQDAVPVALLGQVSQPFVVMSCALGKTSFSISLMRLAAQRFIHRFLWFIVVTMLTLHILISIIVFVHCEDPRTTWNPAIVSKCWHPNAYLGVLYFIGAYSAATDFILALLPWAMLWNLNMKNKEKFGVAVAMSLGVLYVLVPCYDHLLLTPPVPEPSPSSNAPSSKRTQQAPILPTTSVNSFSQPVPRTPSSSWLHAFLPFDPCFARSFLHQPSQARTRIV
ncbi:hypothetical protein NW760_010445 [Fusarium oxysporum]|nr:hypothetical protein NW753_009619 [Fusarium oxysporum]KAJ4046093.1 hypothetical protein NW758_006287 [Fusarium oxysporum]KAJ4223827.1 hypothetical protein NW760_010445 [Fusarium oxysporum]